MSVILLLLKWMLVGSATYVVAGAAAAMLIRTIDFCRSITIVGRPMGERERRRRADIVRPLVEAKAQEMKARGLCGCVIDEHGERVICTAHVPCAKHRL